jgi:hypothetical protein
VAAGAQGGEEAGDDVEEKGDGPSGGRGGQEDLEVPAEEAQEDEEHADRETGLGTVFRRALVGRAVGSGVAGFGRDVHLRILC